MCNDEVLSFVFHFLSLKQTSPSYLSALIGTGKHYRMIVHQTIILTSINKLWPWDWFKILREEFKGSSRITTSECRRVDFSLVRDLFSRTQLATALESKEGPRELVNPQEKNSQDTKPVLSDAEETSMISKSKNNHDRSSSWMERKLVT